MYLDNCSTKAWKHASYSVTWFSCTLIIAVQRHESMLSCFHAFLPSSHKYQVVELIQSFKIPEGLKVYMISYIKITSHKKKKLSMQVSDQIKLFYGFNFHWLLHPHVQIYTNNHDCKDIHGFVRNYFYINLTLMAASTI